MPAAPIITIPGAGSDNLIPQFFGQIVFGAGLISGESQTFCCLAIGMMLTGGTATPNHDVLPVYSTDDIVGYALIGSQLDNMGGPMFAAPGAQNYIAPVPDPAGTAATVTVTMGGTSGTTGGQWGVRIGGQVITGTIPPGSTKDTAGALIAAGINALPHLPATAVYSSSTHILTVTLNHTGAGGNSWIFYWDKSLLPAWLTGTVAGGSVINSDANRVFFGATAGAGVEDYTTVLTKLTSMRFDRIASAAFDATNAALVSAFATQQSAPDTLLYTQVTFAHNGIYSAAQTLASTTLNAYLCQVVWMQNGENHPCQIAASTAALRASVENDDPLFDYDGFALPGIFPHYVPQADSPTKIVQGTALQNGVTPVVTVNGNAVYVRMIVSHCLFGSVADRRTLDVGDVTVPQKYTTDLALAWYSTFKPNNPICQPDPDPNGPTPGPRVAYPKHWKQVALKLATDYATNGWLESPTADDVLTAFDPVAKCILGDIQLRPNRVNHQVKNRVRQVTNS